MQYVNVDIGARRAYTYTWAGEPVKRGDFVMVPGNEVHPEPQAGRVTRILDERPEYDGEFKAIMQVRRVG